MLDGMRENRVSQNTALIAHFGFLSVFPLMIVATTLLGFILRGKPEWREKLVNSAAEQIPIIGPQLASDPGKLKGNTVVLIIGLLVTLWSGTKAFMAIQNGMDDIDGVPIEGRMGMARGRLRALIGIGIIGAAQVVTVFLTTLTGIVDWFGIGEVLLFIAAVIVNVVVVASIYHWLSTVEALWRTRLPGAIFAGVIFTVLQLIGTTIVQRAISKASNVYGTFATVIAMLTWLSLHALVALIGAQINRVMRAQLLTAPQ
ncbi:MAG TPA: YihY/virulence factor BrkB family protein [Ilumatobacteraceae bacterium]|nr:YihY/virulence factor BrkB family protein [Ilumatobacteraceae bacterium]